MLDASAVGAALLIDEGGNLGALAIEVWSNAKVRVPVHWPVEVVSVLVKAERANRITSDECLAAWDDAALLIASAKIEQNVSPGAMFELARHHVLSAQDAAYLELALRIGAPLLTGDKALARAARSLSIPLLFDPK